MLVGVDYYAEHWPEARWPEDARLMEKAGISLVRLAEFAWSRLEPREGQFEFGWLDRALAVLSARGIKAVLGTPTAAPPAWLVEKHPDVLPLDELRQPRGFGARLHRCLSNPYFGERSRAITEAMARHYANHPAVVGWQTDNELEGNRCYCDVCAERFRQWLRERYGSLEALNKTWGTVFWSQEYSSWSQVPLPWRTACGTMAHNPSLLLDYYRFASETTMEFQREQVEIIRSHCPDHFVTHNMMGLHDSVDYYALARDLDFVSWDNYPASTAALAHDLMRGILRKNFWVMEEKSGHTGWNRMSRSPRPGQLRCWAWQAIGRGADAVVFFRWRSCRFGTEQFWQGILNHDGRPGRRYEEIARFAREVRQFSSELDGTEPHNQVAILHSYEQRWALGIQPQAPGFSFRAWLERYHEALRRLGVGCDVVSTEADFSAYKLVICPPLYLLSDELAKRLSRYVEAGGHLVLSARSGVKDLDNVARVEPLPGPLAEVAGLRVEDYDAIGEGANTIEVNDGARFKVSAWCDVVEPTTAEPFARYLEDYYAGRVAVARNSRGAGRAWYVGTLAEPRFFRHLLRRIVAELGIFHIPGLPNGLEVASRRGSNGRILVVTNLTPTTHTLTLASACEDVAARRILAEPLSIGPYGVRLLRIND